MMRCMETDGAPQRRLTFSVSEAADAAGLSRATIYRLIASGDVRSVKVADRRLIPRNEIYRLLGTSGQA